MNNEQVEALKARLTKLEEERTAILRLLEVWGENPPIDVAVPVSRTVRVNQSFTVSGRIIDAAVELVHKLGRPVKNSEIMEYAKEKQLTLGNTDNPDRMLAAILGNEIKKKDARLKKAARGYYEIKQ
ncbi:MAG: hypothetical protein ACHQQQ_13805 [Bacteroidota bacterium]